MHAMSRLKLFATALATLATLSISSAYAQSGEAGVDQGIPAWVLEDMAADGAREITISASRKDDHARVAITVKGGHSGMPLPEARLWTYRRSFARCGAKITAPGKQGEPLIVADLPLQTGTD